MLIECNDCFQIAVCRALQFLRHLRVAFVMTIDRDTPAGARSGITFDVTLEVPWNAPEAYVAVIRVMQGRDARSVRALIPDLRVIP